MAEVPWISLAEVDPDREYLALVTYLPRKRFWSLFSFMRQTSKIRDQLKDSPGLIGYALRAQLLGRKAWTLSVWEDEHALNRFVGKSPHVEVMKQVRLGHERKLVRWKLPGSEVPPKWEEALTHAHG